MDIEDSFGDTEMGDVDRMAKLLDSQTDQLIRSIGLNVEQSARDSLKHCAGTYRNNGRYNNYHSRDAFVQSLVAH